MLHGFDSFCASLYGWHYLKWLIYVIHDSLISEMTHSYITPSRKTYLNDVCHYAFVHDMTNRFLTFCASAHGWHYLPVTWLIHMRHDFLTWNMIPWGIMWLIIQSHHQCRLRKTPYSHINSAGCERLVWQHACCKKAKKQAKVCQARLTK